MPELTEENVRAAFEKFRGDFYQMPPMVSAIKQGGVPLYKLARQGKTVEREPRLVHVYRYSIDRIAAPEIDFTVMCSKGFYVRTYAHDIGAELGCGAHLKELRRTRSGRFDLDPVGDGGPDQELASGRYSGENPHPAGSFADARRLTAQTVMRVLRSIPELAQIPGPVFLAIGVFDGVHLGHQAVISTAARHAAGSGRHGGGGDFRSAPGQDPASAGEPAPAHRDAAQDRSSSATLGVSHLLVLNFDRALGCDRRRTISLGNWPPRRSRCAKFASARSGRLGKTAPAISRS